MTAFNKAWSVLKYYQDSAGRLTVDDPEQGLRPMDMATDVLFPIDLPGPKTLGEFVDDSGRDQTYISHLERRARSKYPRTSNPVRPDTIAPYFRVDDPEVPEHQRYHYRGRPR